MSPLNLTTDQQQLISDAIPFFWANPSFSNDFKLDTDQVEELYAAEARLQRFAPLLENLFPELTNSKGIIESPLLETKSLHQEINPCGSRTLVKADHALPVAGSIKARGGIHEVLCFTEQLALEHQLLDSTEDDYLKLQNSASQALFQQYEIAVGSTGNLGLSVGIIGAALGFKASVHMSVDAKQWKKERLRNRGVNVVEHEADYGAAVAAEIGRAHV